MASGSAAVRGVSSLIAMLGVVKHAEQLYDA